jgi:3-oxoacyl-[acyl-carrier-protein] synthase II
MLFHRVPGNSAIAITGIGPLLPGAFTVDEFWAHLRDGRSQIGQLDRFNTEGFPVKLAAQIRNFDYKKFLLTLPEKFAEKYSREILIVMSALEQARRDARLGREDVEPSRIGFVTSNSRGPMEWWCDKLELQFTGEGTFEGHDMLAGLPSSPTSMAAIYTGIKGLVMNLNSACVGGNQAIHVALRELENNTADMMFVGGYEFPLFRPMLQIYNANSLLSKETGAPSGAMKPYDRRRDGFAFGEGAVVLALERLDRAVARGARVYALLDGVGCMNEANHPTSPDLTGEVTASFLRGMLRAVDCSLGSVDYFCGHGTATRYSDIAEGRAIKALYGSTPRDRWAPMSSVKPIHGHTMGASGVLNVAASALMIYHQCLCPNINLEQPDPDCDWDHVAEGQRSTSVNRVLSMSFALGSQTAAVAMSAPRSY